MSVGFTYFQTNYNGTSPGDIHKDIECIMKENVYDNDYKAG